jgi:hypothetical protein
MNVSSDGDLYADPVVPTPVKGNKFASFIQEKHGLAPITPNILLKVYKTTEESHAVYPTQPFTATVIF